MQNFIKIKQGYLKYQKIINTAFFLLLLPLGLIVLELVMRSIFNLGSYTGTFLRCLYDIVVY